MFPPTPQHSGPESIDNPNLNTLIVSSLAIAMTPLVVLLAISYPAVTTALIIGLLIGPGAKLIGMMGDRLGLTKMVKGDHQATDSSQRHALPKE